jgi:hypothetical protein
LRSLGFQRSAGDRRVSQCHHFDRVRDEHVGIVRNVAACRQIQTIEGNYENKVAANVRTPTEATGAWK